MKTGNVSQFNNKNYKVSVSIELTSSRMRPLAYVFDIGAGPKLITADVLDLNWLDSISQRDILEIGSTSTIKLTVSGTITPLCGLMNCTLA